MAESAAFIQSWAARRTDERRTEGARMALMAGGGEHRALRARIMASTRSGVSRRLRTVARTGNYVMDCGPGSPATRPRTSSASRLDLRACRCRRSPTVTHAFPLLVLFGLFEAEGCALRPLLTHAIRQVDPPPPSPLGTPSWPSPPPVPASMHIVVHALSGSLRHWYVSQPLYIANLTGTEGRQPVPLDAPSFLPAHSTVPAA